jgi:hypothetical protein
LSNKEKVKIKAHFQSSRFNLFIVGLTAIRNLIQRAIQYRALDIREDGFGAGARVGLLERIPNRGEGDHTIWV